MNKGTFRKSNRDRYLWDKVHLIRQLGKLYFLYAGTAYSFGKSSNKSREILSS